LRCPVCKDEMIVLELDQVEIDYCTGCGGIWLDEGELELLLQGAGENEKDTLLASFAKATDTKEKKKKCPVCRRRMDKIFCGGEEKILLDSCPRSHGLWFDRGELEQLLAIGGLEEGSRVATLLKDLFKH
jgi:Zn-finger nucleic acid-binding protein